MEKELNIAAILKEKPKNTRLWTPIFGDCELLGISDYIDPIQVITGSGAYGYRTDGKYAKNGEVCLFPSKQMQDWSKFAWKKGDVLAAAGDSNFHVLFMHWASNDYTRFRCKDEDSLTELENDTRDFVSVSDEEAKKTIKKIEEGYGGKLNLETLEIEKQPEFEDGDILHCDETDYSVENIFIAKMHGEAIGSYTFLCVHNYKLYIKDCDCDESELPAIRLATDSEKQQLFDALAKEDKRWNPETKTIEDLPKKCELKPFDKVLVRDRYNDEWMTGFFSHYIESSKDFVCTSGSWRQCIPYNEETKYLLGTTDEWK